MNTELEKFIELAGSQAKAARLIGVTEAAISNYRKGKHGLSKRRAKAIADIYPNISMLGLMFPDGIPPRSA